MCLHTRVTFTCFQHFVSDFSAVVGGDTLKSEENVQDMNRVICEHFLRHGMLDTAQCLIKVKYSEFV